MIPGDKGLRSIFSPEERRAFVVCAIIIGAIGVGLFVVAPKGLGQALGVAFAAALLPIPPSVVYFLRRRKLSKKKNA